MLAEVLDQSGHQVLAGGEHRAQTQFPLDAGRDSPSGLGALLEKPDDMGRVPRVLTAGRRRPDIPPRPLGQLDSELALERGNGGGNGRLRDDELLRGGRNRPMPNDGKKRRQLRVSNSQGKLESI